MNEREFVIGDVRYQLRKIDAFQQFHIVRRLGPILGDIIKVAQKIKAKGGKSKEKDKTEEEKFQEIAQLVTPIMDGLSKLSDKNSNIVLMGLLSAAEIHQANTNNWARIVVGKSLMIQTLTMPEMLQIAGRALFYNLADFFPSAHPISRGGK